MLTCAEKLRQEGKIETIETLPGVGVDRALIMKATRIMLEESQRLKVRLKALIEPTFAEDAPLQ